MCLTVRTVSARVLGQVQIWCMEDREWQMERGKGGAGSR